MAQGVTIDFNANLARWTSQIDKVTDDLGRFESNATRIAGNIKGVLAGIGAGVAVGAMAAAVKESINLQDELGKMAQKTGISVEALSTLKYAGDLTDVSLDSLGISIKTLSNAMTEAKGGSKEFGSVFKALGVDVAEADGTLRNSEQVILDIADKFAEMEDGAGKSALAMKIFGKSGQDMIPLLNEGRDSIQAMREEARAFGLEISTEAAAAAEEFNDNLTRLKASTDGLKMSMTKELLPSLLEVSNAMNEATKESGLLMGIWVGMGGAMSNLLFGPEEVQHINEVKDSIADLRGELGDLERAKEGSVGGGLLKRWLYGDDEEIDQKIAETTRQLEAAQKQLAYLTKPATIPSAVASGAKKKQAPVIEKQGKEKAKNEENTIANLERQVALYGDASEAARVKYEIESGSYRDLSQAQKDRLMNLAEELDFLKANDEALKQSISTQNEWAESSKAATEEAMRAAKSALDNTISEMDEAMMSPADAAVSEYMTRSEALVEAWEKDLITEQEYQALEQQNWIVHQQALTEIQKKAADERTKAQEEASAMALQVAAQTMDLTLGVLEESGRESSSLYKTLFAIQKAAAIPQIIVSAQVAAAKVREAFSPYGEVQAQAVLAAGYASAGIVAGQVIAGVAHGGLDNVPSEATYLLDQGERVLSPRQNLDITEAARRINQGGNGGGGVTVQLIEDASRAGQVERSRMSEEEVVSIFVSNIRTRGPAAQAIETHYQGMERRGR